jgi:hypothetical protein
MIFWTTIKSPSHIIVIIAIAVGAHLLALAVKMMSQRLIKTIPKLMAAPYRCQRMYPASRGTATPVRCGITRAV